MNSLLPMLLFLALAQLLGGLAPEPMAEARPGTAAWLSLTSDAEGGLVEAGGTVTFTATVRNSSRNPLAATLEWGLTTLAFDPPTLEPLRIQVPGRETRTFELAVPMEGPGFCEAEVSVLTEGARSAKRRRRRVGCAPDEVLFPLTAAEDFDDFWERTLEELAAVDPQAELRAVERSPAPRARLYELTLRSLGGVRVRGWLQVPLAKGPHPAILRVPGYTQTMRPLDEADDAIVLSFNIRAHGNSTDDVPGHPIDYWLRGLDDPDAYFYRGAYADCVRAVQYLCSRDDVDQERLAVWGASQGGGLAFATAALDPRIDLCIADIPWLCHWQGLMELVSAEDRSDVERWLGARPGRTVDGALQTLSYFDTMNLAGRIQCRTLMGVGLQDPICPPATSFAAFNRVKGEREFRIDEDRGHGLGGDHTAWVMGRMLAEFAR